MRLSIVRGGKPETVEVDLATSTVEVRGRRFSYKVVHESPERIELEVGGEKVTVEGWPKGLPQPPGPVDVNGERWRLSEVKAEGASARPPPPTPTAAPDPKPVVTPAMAPTASSSGPGTAVVPPMPGKVIEVRVKVGDHVEKGQVLLVLEAMKMRNELPSPVRGRVIEVAVSAGANVRARETMLRVQSD